MGVFMGYYGMRFRGAASLVRPLLRMRVNEAVPASLSPHRGGFKTLMATLLPPPPSRESRSMVL